MALRVKRQAVEQRGAHVASARVGQILLVGRQDRRLLGIQAIGDGELHLIFLRRGEVGQFICGGAR
ncbi:hypothetical protein EIO60_01622|nr:hypothetical protein [Candidatus Pantoea persica]